jgi:hypothetical protein
MRAKTVDWMDYVLPSDGKNHETSGIVACHAEKLLGLGDSSCLKMSPEEFCSRAQPARFCVDFAANFEF